MPISIPETLSTITETWSPHLIARTNDHDIKLAKLDGDFVFHDHPETDELFYVLAGEVTIKLEDNKNVDLVAGDVYVVPKGVRHCPVGRGASVLLMEKVGTINTGNEESDRTKAVADVRR